MKTVKLVRNYLINLKNIGLYLSRDTETEEQRAHAKDIQRTWGLTRSQTWKGRG